MNAISPSIYPERSVDRDRWILDRRLQRNALDPSRPYAFFVEDECSESGEIVPVATILLTNRECPWRCVMCDLWKNTLTESVRPGAIPSQIEYALKRLPPVRQIKLYNSGSFFDRRAIPLVDYARIAELVSGFERVIVECHPALVNDECFRFSALVSTKLEVAMGLETAHPQVLEKLNKHITLESFTAASERLRESGIGLRVFLLIQPPFMKQEEALEWAKRSLDCAFECGATAVTLIPTRTGNGAMEELAQLGNFVPAQLATLEAALVYGITRDRGRVFADLWDTSQLQSCPDCLEDRLERISWMNLHQAVSDVVPCELCEGTCGE